MQMKKLWVLSFLFLIFLGGKTVRGQDEVCSLTTYFWDNDTKSSSSRSLVAKFPLEFNEDALVREFRDKESEVNVKVGVEQVTSFPKRDAKRIRIAISFEGEPANVFDELNRAEAETAYDRNWRWVSVSKSVKVGSRVYTYTFGCERKKK